MQAQFDVNQFKKYFFYGLENKDEIVKSIIVNIAKQRKDKHHHILEEKIGKTDYEIDAELMMGLIVQLERFTTLHDNPNNRQYFFNDMNINSLHIREVFERNLNQLKEIGAIVPCTYRGFSGIYYADRKAHWTNQKTGEEMYNFLKENSSWAQEEVYDILQYLEELEKNNKYQYYSLFLDTKYARAINRYQKGVTKDEAEKQEIVKVYRKLLKSIQVSSVDIKLALQENMDDEKSQYIDENYPTYDTITSLKSDATDDNYLKRVQNELNNINQKVIKKEGREL